jgi:hypothetical protein
VKKHSVSLNLLYNFNKNLPVCLLCHGILAVDTAREHITLIQSGGKGQCGSGEVDDK